MSFRTFKGYVLVVFSGALLLIAALLVILQWGKRAQFSLFGYPYDIILVEDRLQGGINTALMMIFSAIGGVVIVLLCRVFFSGLRVLRSSQRLAEMEKQQQQNA